MQGTAGICESQEQATRRILVVRIIFNNGGSTTRLSNIALADVPLNSAFESMATGLERSSAKALTYLIEGDQGCGEL